MCRVFIVLCVLFLTSLINAKKPDHVQKCAAGDKKCIIKNVNLIFSTKFTGDADFGLVQLDPMLIKNINIAADPNSPVKVDLKFMDTELLGVKNLKLTKVKGFGKDPAAQHDLLMEGPLIALIGHYKVKGQVLILPVRGEGKSNITIIEPKLKLGIKGTTKSKDGLLYMDVESSTFDLNCEKMVLHFENLFNGDKALGDNFNMFLNQNWRDIYEDIKKPFLSEINKALFTAIRKVFDATPYNEIFENSN